MPGRDTSVPAETVHLPDITNAAERMGVEVAVMNDYGVGIDCHSKFIQVCVLRKDGGRYLRFEREFSTAWASLKQAHFWAFAQVHETDRTVKAHEFRYVIESTGTYHLPVLRAWRGAPSVINPQLAGATKRKTDVLDARLLATHGVSGLWPTSFIVDDQGEQLRLLINMRFEAGRNATRALNRINNCILRFGHTLGAVQKMADSTARAIIEDLCDGRAAVHEYIAPDGIPEAIRPFFKRCYAIYDHFAEIREEYHNRALKFVKSHEWRVAGGTADGKTLLDNLTSVSGVGEVSAMTWLSVVLDPNRFQETRQVAAFCGCDPSLKVSAGKVTSYAKRKGNARLHHVLKNVAAQLVRRRSEPIGQWGFGIQRRHAKGGWARAINAVARRLAACLWHVHRNNAAFTLEQYRFFLVPEVQDVPVEAMNLDTRYTRLLKEAGCNTSKEVAAGFNSSLPQQKGIGAGCLQRVKEWLDQHKVHPDRNRPQQTVEEKLHAAGITTGSSSAGSSAGVRSTKRKPTPTASAPASSTALTSAAASCSRRTRGTRKKSSASTSVTPSVKKSRSRSASVASAQKTAPRTP